MEDVYCLPFYSSLNYLPPWAHGKLFYTLSFNTAVLIMSNVLVLELFQLISLTYSHQWVFCFVFVFLALLQFLAPQGIIV